MKKCDPNEISPTPSKAFGDFPKHTVGLDSDTSERNVERFHALACQFATTGHALHYVEHSTTYYAERWGHIRDFATLDDARKFLVQISGNHG